MCRRVLIVDDNSAFRAAARQLLERGGFVVVAEAGDGVEAAASGEGAHVPTWRSSTCSCPTSTGSRSPSGSRALDPAPEVILTSSLDGTDFGALVAGSSALGFIPKAELSAPAIEALLAPAR